MVFISEISPIHIPLTMMQAL